MNQCFHYYYCYTNNNRITGTCTLTPHNESTVKSGVASSANTKFTSSTNNNRSNNHKITLLLILSIISTTSTVLAAPDDYFEIRVDPLGNAVETLVLIDFMWLTSFWVTLRPTYTHLFLPGFKVIILRKMLTLVPNTRRYWLLTLDLSFVTPSITVCCPRVFRTRYLFITHVKWCVMS